MRKLFRANGKLLLTGEYAVLDGAKALAIPTRLGQAMEVYSHYGLKDVLSWRSLNEQNKCWFTAEYGLQGLGIKDSSDSQKAEFLRALLQYAFENAISDFSSSGILIQTRLDFPNNWGLGTSSTLIFLISRWLGVDPFKLVKATIGGSGYDIACASASGPIIYHIEKNEPNTKAIEFAPPFLENLYFIYLGKKKDSREGIKEYREKKSEKKYFIEKISQITHEVVHSTDIQKFNELIQEHEFMVADQLKTRRLKDELFKDFWGEIKSLGAWGGDFALISSTEGYEKTRAYFINQGIKVFIKYKDMIYGKA